MFYLNECRGKILYYTRLERRNGSTERNRFWIICLLYATLDLSTLKVETTMDGEKRAERGMTWKIISI